MQKFQKLQCFNGLRMIVVAISLYIVAIDITSFYHFIIFIIIKIDIIIIMIIFLNNYYHHYFHSVFSGNCVGRWQVQKVHQETLQIR